MNAPMNPLAESVLGFWFGSTELTLAVVQGQIKKWFSGDKDVDYDIERRFGKLVSVALKGGLNLWADQPRSALALTLVLDQFPRNLYRGTAHAFAGDSAAQLLCKKGISLGFHQQLHPVEALFFLLPLEHSEQLEDQETLLQLLPPLFADLPEEWQPITDGFIDYAVKHRDLIQQFGRFPHRNQVLSRPSTEEERLYLETAEHFGQKPTNLR